MKDFLLGILVLAVVLACTVGSAPAQTPAKPDWKDSFRTHDRNVDGKIDRAEFREWMADSFFIVDENHKGYLVFEDVKSVMNAKTFKGQDKDGNGKVTLQEFLDASFQDFAAADGDKNGALTLEEFEVYFRNTGK